MIQELVTEVSPQAAPYVWDEAESYLRRAIDVPDIETFIRLTKAKIFAGIHSLWQIKDEVGNAIAYVVTCIYTPDGLVNIAQIYIAAGEDVKQMIPHLDQFEVWARGREIDYIEVIGRRGWERVLAPEGFEFNYTSLLRKVKRELN